MAPVAPEQIFPGYQALMPGDSAPDEGIFIPLVDLTGLTTEEAALTTGAIGKVLYAIIFNAEKNYNFLPTAERSSRFSITRNNAGGTAPGLVSQGYTITSILSLDGADIAPEA